MEKLPESLRRYRNKMFGELWGKYKGNLTMTDLAKILNISLPRLFQILKREHEKNPIKKLFKK